VPRRDARRIADFVESRRRECPRRWAARGARCPARGAGRLAAADRHDEEPGERALIGGERLVIVDLLAAAVRIASGHPLLRALARAPGALAGGLPRAPGHARPAG